jgi:hypothetical protein
MRWRRCNDFERVIEQLKNSTAASANRDHLRTAHELHQSGRDEDSLLLFQQTLESQKKTIGIDHLDTINTMHNIAHCLSRLGRDKESVVMMEAALEKQSRVLKGGKDHPDALVTMTQLAFSLNKLKRREESLVVNKDCLERQERVLGESHSDTLGIMYAVAVQQVITHREDEAYRTASRGLLLARKNGFEQLAAQFVEILSRIDVHEQSKAAATGSSEQDKDKVMEKIRFKKEAKEKAAAEAARLATLATLQEPMTDTDLDVLMAEFGFDEEEGKKKSAGGGKKKGKGKGKGKK